MTTNTKTKKTYEPIQDLDGEVWRDIPNYEGFYQVSNMGRIKSQNYRHKHLEVLKKFATTYNGYYRVCLCVNNIRKSFFVHRLVYETFVGTIPKNTNKTSGDDILTINHKDENKQNNKLENLELITLKENVNYGTAKRRNALKRVKKVYQYTMDFTLVKIWESASECGRNGFSFRNISLCCLNKKKNYKGFMWSFTPLFNNDKM